MDTVNPDNPAERPRASRRLADLVGDGEAPVIAARPNEALAGWIKILVLAAAFVVLTWWQYPRLVKVWINDSNWTHGFIIPLFSLFLLYQRRADIAAAHRKSCWWGLPILLVGIAAMLYCVYPVQNVWLSQLCMLVILFGMVLLVGGWQLAKWTWLPIAYLALAMPLPGTLYERIAYPLQEVAAAAAAGLLRMIGAEVYVQASELSGLSWTGQPIQLTVAEACSGVRSLMAFVALGVAMAYIDNRPMWQRLVLLATILPVAVLVNIARVFITTYMHVIDRPELGTGFSHTFIGMIMLIPAGLLFLLISWLLRSLFVEDDDDKAGDVPAGDKATARPRPRLSDMVKGGE